MLKFYRVYLVFFLSSFYFLQGQNEQIKIHSHNDYLQTAPFWNAYANGLNSIEVDVFLKNKTLYATHSEAEIKKGHTLSNLYLKPLQKVLDLKLGKQQEVQLLVDIKSEAYSTMKALITLLKGYPEIIASNKVAIVISGNRPKVVDYVNYPDYITFDYQSLTPLTDKVSQEKVALVSLDFKSFSHWNGKGRLTASDYKKVKSAIDQAHAQNKPFRFWGAPDSKSAWKAFSDMGVDFINTDMPFKAATYLTTLPHRAYYNKAVSEVYTPTYASDQTKNPIKNVILLIGDGNGLSQISAATLANGGELTMTQLKSIGFIKTQSADDFTTDSAAAGTALATGEKTYNRAIGVATSKEALVNITEKLFTQGFLSGCITTDAVVGATPASFYAHQLDRSDEKQIADDLLSSKLSLFVGGGADFFQNDWKSSNFTILDNVNAIGNNKAAKVGCFIAANEVPSVLNGRRDVLAQATKNGIAFLHAKNKPFFLMVEGAQIDSFGHNNNVGGIVTEGIDFDKAVTEAIKFADKTKNTLVIITADHETSGFGIPQGKMKDKMIEGDFMTHDHTATMVPIFAYGPYSQEFQGVYENSDVYGKILKVLGVK